jgi:putative DNA methylase
MIPATCKRLIEVDFPIAKVSEHSAREKSIRHGHPSTLHLWWARRPLAACRAVLLGLLLPAPTEADCPADFKTKARVLLKKRHSKALTTDAELQDDLLAFIGEFANWDHAANSMYLEIGRGLVKAAHPEETPVVVDPFSGVGSIPLEALRLGCEAFASDLNPVACLILKTLLEDIPRYGNAEFTLTDDKGKEIVVHGLADALRHVGKQVKAAAEKELAQFYPPDPDGSRPIAYLWARTVRCEGIGCGAEIPIFKSPWFSRRTSKKAKYFRENPKGGCVAFLIESAPKGGPIQFRIARGDGSESSLKDYVSLVASKASGNNAHVICPCCSVPLDGKRVRVQLRQQRGGAEVLFDPMGKRIGGAYMLAVVRRDPATERRSYRLPTPKDYEAVWAATKATANSKQFDVEGEINPTRPSPNARGVTAPTRYGATRFADLFTSRQRVCLGTFASILNESREEVRLEPPFPACLALALGRSVDQSSAQVRWIANIEAISSSFPRQALQMTWDFVESIPIADESANFGAAIEWIAKVIEVGAGSISKVGQVQQADARELPLDTGLVSTLFTDPPYYDAVPYSDLSDFFYVWLKKVHTSSFVRTGPDGLTPKSEECVWNQAHFVDSRPKDEKFFEESVEQVFRQGIRVLRYDGIACVVFAHKTTEGWEALLKGLVSAGWVFHASWPIVTERSVRTNAQSTASLASSVHLVCRPRPADAGVGDWSEVKAAMEKRVREWLPTLIKHGVRGADAIFSCLGPALESYSRYDKVLTAGDQEVPLGGDPDAIEPEKRGFLAYVFETLSKEALRQVLGDADTEGFEEDARMTALFLWTLQATQGKAEGSRLKAEGEEDSSDSSDQPDPDDDEGKAKKAKAGFTMPFDTFIRITRPMGIHYAVLEHRVIEIEKGVVRLLPVRDRSEQLLGEAATRPGIQISLEDVQQMELGLIQKPRMDTNGHESQRKQRKGKKAEPASAFSLQPSAFSTLDRIHRAMLLFSMGLSALLRQVLEKELRQNKRFERLSLALNALYPDGSDERRMLEGVQAAMRGVR